MGKKFDKSKLKSKLSKLSQRADSIQELAKYIFDLKKHSESVVNLWMDLFVKGDDNMRLTQLYLVNEILQTCKRMNAIVYKGVWQPQLKRCFEILKDVTVIDKVIRMTKIWKERRVYEDFVITDFLNTLESSKPPSQEEVVNKVIENFNPDEPIELLNIMNTLEQEVNQRMFILDHLQIDMKTYQEDPTACLSRIKDKEYGKQFSSRLQEDHQRLSQLKHSLEEQKIVRKKVLDLLENAEMFYEHQMKEVDLVTSAYRDYEMRIRDVEKDLLSRFDSLPQGDDKDVKNVPKLSLRPVLDYGDDSDNEDYIMLDNLADAPSPGNTPPHMRRSSTNDYRESYKRGSIIDDNLDVDYRQAPPPPPSSSNSLQNKIHRLVVDMDVSDEESEDILSFPFEKKSIPTINLSSSSAPPPPPPMDDLVIGRNNVSMGMTFPPPPPPPPPPPRAPSSNEDYSDRSSPGDRSFFRPPPPLPSSSSSSSVIVNSSQSNVNNTLSFDKNALDLISKITQLPGLIDSLRNIQRSTSLLPTPPSTVTSASTAVAGLVVGPPPPPLPSCSDRNTPCDFMDDKSDEGGATPTLDEPMPSGSRMSLGPHGPTFNPNMPPPPLGNSIPTQITLNGQGLSTPWSVWPQSPFSNQPQISSMGNNNNNGPPPPPPPAAAAMFPPMFSSILSAPPRINNNYANSLGNVVGHQSLMNQPPPPPSAVVNRPSNAIFNPHLHLFHSSNDPQQQQSSRPFHFP